MSYHDTPIMKDIRMWDTVCDSQAHNHSPTGEPSIGIISS